MLTASFLGPLKDVPLPPVMRHGASVASAAGAPPGAIDFTIQVQQQTRWCWAAVTASVADYFAARGGPPAPAQCELATQLLHFPCCVVPLPPPPPPYWRGNMPYLLSAALGAAGHLANAVSKAVDFPAIKQEIVNSKPVCCRIYWDDDPNGHYVVIMGCHDDGHEQDVVVLDPSDTAPHEGSFPFDEFKSFGGGSWDNTCFTQ